MLTRTDRRRFPVLFAVIAVLALACAALAATFGLFGSDGPPSAYAQTDTTAPTVSSVAITSDPDENDADLGDYESGGPGRSSLSSAWASGVYRMGDDVKVTVTFSENVTVTGSPQLKLAIGSNTRTADYESTDGSAAIFSYTVSAGDSDSDGIAIGANKLTLNGGSVKDAADNDASLAHNALSAQDGHKVDGVRPRLMGVRFLSSSDGSDGAYSAGEELMIIAEFNSDESGQGPIRGSASAKVKFDLEDEEKAAAWDWSLRFNDTRENVAYFAYVVQEGDLDRDGPAISANSVVLNGGFIRDAAGNDAVLTHEAVEAGTHFIVDAVAPTVSSIAITSDPGDDDTYGSGDKIEVTVTFSEKMSFPISSSCSSHVVHCEAELELAIGGTARTAAYQSHDGAEAVYAYTVQAGDSDDNGIAIGANKLTGQSIRDAAGRLGEGINDADLSHDAVAADSGHKVDGGLSSALTVSGDVTIRIQENRPTYVARYEVSGRNGSLTWSLTGDDSDDFTIIGGLDGLVNFRSSPNFEAPTDADADNEYEFTVNASDGMNDASLHVTVVVTNERHDADELPVITGTAQVGQTLTVDTSPIGGMDENTTFYYAYYAWYRTEGDTDTHIDGATSSSYTVTDDDEGKTIKVVVSFRTTDGRFRLTSAPTEVVVSNSDQQPINTPATGVPTIRGTAQVGETLTANTSGIADADGLSNVQYEYQWLADDAAIEGATGYTYTLSDTDEGKAIRVQVSFTDDEGNAETLTSAGTAVPPSTTPGEPQNLELTPVAVGTNGVGIKVFWDAPSATGGSDISGYRIQWKGGSQDYPDDQETRQAFVENAPYTIDTTSPTPIEGDELTVRIAAVSGAGAGVWTEKIGWLPSHTDLELWLLMKEYADEKQTTFPWVLETWNYLDRYEVPVEVGPTPGFGSVILLPCGSPYTNGDDGLKECHVEKFKILQIEDPKPRIIIHEMAHVYSLANRVTEAPGPLAIAHLYFDSLNLQGGLRGCEPRELYADVLTMLTLDIDESSYWKTCNGDNAQREAQALDVLRSAVDGEMPQWFADTYTDAEDEPDLERLWTDVQDLPRIERNVAVYQLRDAFGGYCNNRLTWKSMQYSEDKLTQPWMDGGCPPPEPSSLEVTPGDGELTLAWDAPASDGDSDVEGYIVQWKSAYHDWAIRQPRAVLDSPTSLTYTISGLGNGVPYDVRVRAYNAIGPGQPLDVESVTPSEPVIPNTPATGVPTISGTAQVGETLTVDTSGIADEDGMENGSFTFLWKVYDATGWNFVPFDYDGTYTIEPRDVGMTIHVIVLFEDDRGNFESVGSASTDAVAAAPAANSPAIGVPTISGTAQVGETLEADTSGVTDADGLSNVQYEYQWLADDSDISGAANATYTLVAEDEGKAITVQVSFTDDADNEETLTSGATDTVEAAPNSDLPVVSIIGVPRPNSPATGAPTISGTAQAGQTLTADASGIVDEDGLENDEVSFQWSAYDNATGLYLLRMIELEGTYTIEPRDVGMAISVIAIFTDDRGNTESLESAPTEPVAAAANTPAAGAPVIIGTAQVGETLTADTSGIADMDGLTNGLYGYQWVKNDGTTDSDITGAMGSTYRLGADDQGKAIKLRVRFSDDAGNWETLTSSATAAVPIEATFTFKIDGTTVTCDSYDVHIVPKKECDDPTSIDQGENTDIEVGIEIDRSVSRQSHKFRFGIYQVEDTLGRLQGHEANDFCLGPGLAESVSIEVAPADGTGPFTYTDEGTIFELCPAGTYTLAVFWYRYNYTDQEYEYAGTFRRFFFINSINEEDTSIERVKFITALYPDPSVSHDDVQIEATKGSTVLNRELATFSLSIGGLVPDSDPDTTDYVVRLRVIGNDSEGTRRAVAWCHVGNVGYSYLLKTVPEDGRWAMDAHVLGSCLWHWWPDTLQIELFNGSYEFIAGKEIALGELPNSPATGAPTINGAAEIGETLTVSTSGIQDANGLSGATFSYQWLGSRDTEIQGATNATYTLVAADEGKAIKVRVSFTDDRGNAESLTSAPTAAVEANANNPATGLPTISGTAQVGETLTAGITGIADADGLSGESFTYQWVSGDGTTDTDIENATGATYKLVDADQGKAIKVRVTFTDGGGNEETLTSAPTGAVEEQPVLGDGPPGAPRNLAATAGNKEVTLSWDPPADNGNAPATGYRIEWRVDGKDYDKNIWGTAGSTTYTTNDQANLANGVKYFFRVSAGNGSGYSYGPYGPASGEVSATPTSGSAVDLGTPVLSNTENLHHGMVRLDWEDIEDAGWYVVQYYHLDGGSGEWVDLPAEGVDIAFHGSSAVVSNLHGLSWLRVRAMSCAGESEWSQIEQSFGTNASDWEGVPVPEVEVEEGDEIEPCPVVLGTPVLSDTENLHHGMVQLDWEDIEDAGWYVVQYYHVKGGEWLDLPAVGVDIAFHGSSAVVSNLHGLSWLRVRAMSCAGESEWSQIEELYGTNASDWEGVPVPEVEEGDEIEPCSEDADTSDNSPATGAPTISGTVQVGETLTADTSGIADADGLSNVQYEYQWLADDADISGATNATYTLTDSEESKAITVQVGFTDDAGNEETLTSAATAVVAAALPPPPDNVRAVAKKSGAVELTWDAPQDATVTGYRIERRPTGGNPSDQGRSAGIPRDHHTLVEDTGSADTGYTDNTAQKGRRVRVPGERPQRGRGGRGVGLGERRGGDGIQQHGDGRAHHQWHGPGGRDTHRRHVGHRRR